MKHDSEMSVEMTWVCQWSDIPMSVGDMPCQRVSTDAQERGRAAQAHSSVTALAIDTMYSRLGTIVTGG